MPKLSYAEFEKEIEGVVDEYGAHKEELMDFLFSCGNLDTIIRLVEEIND